MSFEAQVGDLLHYKYLFTDLPRDAWPTLVFVKIYLRLLSVYDTAFEYDDGEAASSSNSIHQSFVHIYRCLRVLGIDHLAPKIRDLTDKTRALRIVSAIDDKIMSRYSLDFAARRNRILIKKEQRKTSKVRHLPDPTQKLNEDNGNYCDLPAVSSSPPKMTHSLNTNFTTQEKWLRSPQDSPTSDSTDEIILLLAKGRQLPRTPVKQSLIPEEECQVSSENTGNINNTDTVESFVEVADSDEIPIDNVLPDLNNIPTGKQIPRTPNLQDEINLNTEKYENPLGIHNLAGLHNIIQESIEECEHKEGFSSDISLSCRSKLLKEKLFSDEQWANESATKLRGCETYQSEVKALNHVAAMSSGLQSKPSETYIPTPLDKTCVPKLLDETCVPTPLDETYVPKPLDETCVPMPLDETYVPTPLDETYIPTPLDEAYVPTPLDETYVPTPLDETYVPTPLDEAYVPTPLDETYVPTPLDETCVTAPLDETCVPTPLDETYVPSPLNETYVHKPLDETFVATSFDETYIITPPLEYKASTLGRGCHSNPSRPVRTQETYFLHESALSEYFEPGQNYQSSTRSKKMVLTPGGGLTIEQNTLKSSVCLEKCSRESNELSVSVTKNILELKLSDENGMCILTPPIDFKDKTFSGTEVKLISKAPSNEHPVQQDECTLPYLDIPSKDLTVKQYIAKEDCNSFGQLLPKISSVVDENRIGRDDSLANCSAYTSSTSLHSVVNKKDNLIQSSNSEKTVYRKDAEVSKSVCNDKDLLISQTIMEISENCVKDGLISEEPSMSLEVSSQDTINAAYSSISSENLQSSILELEFNDSLDIFPQRKKEVDVNSKDIFCNQTKVFSEGVEDTTENSTEDVKGDSSNVNIKAQTKLRIPKKIKIISSNSLKSKIKILMDENNSVKIDNVFEVNQISLKQGRKIAEGNSLQAIKSDILEQSTDNEVKVDCKENSDTKDIPVSDRDRAKQCTISRIKRSGKQETISRSAVAVKVGSSILDSKTKPARKLKTKITSDAISNNKGLKEFEDSTNEAVNSETSSATNIDFNQSLDDNVNLAISARGTKKKERTRGSKFATNKSSKVEEDCSKVLSVIEEVEKPEAVVVENIKSRLNVTRSNIDDFQFSDNVQNKVQLKENSSVPVTAVKPKKSTIKAASGVQKEESLKPNSQSVKKVNRKHEKTLDKRPSQTSTDKGQMEMKESDCPVSSSRERVKGKQSLKLSKLDGICEDLQSLCMEPGYKVRSQISVGEEPTTKLNRKKTKVNINADQSIESEKVQPEDEIGIHLRALSLNPVEKSSLESHKGADSVLHNSSIPIGKQSKKVNKTKKVSEHPITNTDIPVLDKPVQRGNQRRASRNNSSISQKKVLDKEIVSPSHDQAIAQETKVEKQEKPRSRISTSRRNSKTVSVEKENVPNESSNAKDSGTEDQKLKNKTIAAKKRSTNNKSLLEKNTNQNSSPLRVQSGRRCKAKALTAISEIYNDSDA